MKKIEQRELNILRQIILFNLNASNEKVLILGDKGAKGYGASKLLCDGYEKVCKELKLNVTKIIQEPRLKSHSADKKVIEALAKLPKNSIVINQSSFRLGHLSGLSATFRELMYEKEHKFISAVTLGTLKDIDLPVLFDALDIDYVQIGKATDKLSDLLTNTQKVRVTSPKGTDIEFSIKGRKGISSIGVYREFGQGGNLPGAESYIAPVEGSANGVIVIDASSKQDKTIKVKVPMKLEITNGIITGIYGGPSARSFLDFLKRKSKDLSDPLDCLRLCEFGIGTNPNSKIVGATIIDEKVLGTAHFAFGSNKWFGGKINTKVHVDQVFYEPTIYLDGKKIDVCKIINH